MSKVTYLHIGEPSEGHFHIKEVQSADEANTVSASILAQNRFNAFHARTASLLGDKCIDFSWPAGPIEVKGVVSPHTSGIGMELIFNDGDDGYRTIGVFWGSLKDGIRIEYAGSKNARIDVILRESKYVHVDAERGQWAKKRVILILPEPGESKI